MKCRLCDRPTAAGTGKLCTDCAKALQRARGATLSKSALSAVPATEVTAAPPITLTIAPPTVTARQPHRLVLWASLGLAAIALVWLAQNELAALRTEAPGGKRLPAPMTESVNVEPAPVVTRVEEPSWTTVPDSVKTSPGADEPHVPVATNGPLAPVAPAGAKGARSAKSAGQDTKSMPSPLSGEHDVAAPKAAEADPSQLAGGKVAVPAQPVDGAQVLASAMQKCGNEGLFSKFICEQRTYMQYCEDKWDKDPKCTRKVGER